MELEKLKQRILTGTPSEQMEVVDELVASNNERAAELFIELLESTDPQVRNSVALGIYELKPPTALEPLLTAIFKPENHNYNGTLVYALEQLDCTNKLKDVFRILFYESYEAKMSAYAILDKQIFEFTRTELQEIQAMWNDLLDNPEKCPGFNSDDTKEMIEVSVEGFMGYLNGKNTDGNRR
ncbi:HEAT repeat domain-containing protein [Ekhidna sp. MALMAid0563]|uniref:HEAT repeat domain-containing protein n=1 Tax=Ekhidna sp. MALMAid0563 TaxID=3143937 RepID=UPI0032DF0FDE